jgi:hypothetical protein
VDALYEVGGEGRFQPTEFSRGGWADDIQHGGPPSGLLAREIERVPSAFPMQVVRLTVDLFRPVPLNELTVEHRTLRDGRRIQVVEAVLRSADLEVGLATGLKIRVTELDLPPGDIEAWSQPPAPEAAAAIDVREFWPGVGDMTRFHTHAIEMRIAEGSFRAPGPRTSWFRLKRDVVAGEVPSAFVRLATLADVSNGNSQRLDSRRWLFVNPDITLYLSRLPVSEWIGMRSEAHQHATGIGLADTRLFDIDGPFGRINQAQLIDRR